MDGDQSVIHKQVYRLNVPVGDLVQSFEVPATAELVAIDWDTREKFGIAFWYRYNKSHPGYTGPEYTTTWTLEVRGTGDSFDQGHRHLATVIRDGFAWHVLAVNPAKIRWAKR